MKQHFVRIGTMGHVGRFSSVDSVVYPRGSRVICDTSRGQEVGEVLSPVQSMSAGGTTDGLLLRGITPEDELLLARLEKHRDRAYEACRSMLAEKGVSAVLMEVEHLFDGQSLYFYFLGEVPPQIESLTAELADVYDTHVEFRKFTETLTQGCGPGCGTDEAEGGGCTSSCASCTVGCRSAAR